MVGLLTDEEMIDQMYGPNVDTPTSEIYRLLGLNPNLRRGTILPIARNEQGGLEAAVPQSLIDLARAFRLPARAMGGGSYGTEDIANFALNTGALGAVGTKPAGALASGAARASKPSALPMDEASRMARAAEMGFDVDRIWYRGLADPHDPAVVPGVGHETPATFLTDNPANASAYAMQNGDRVMMTYGEYRQSLDKPLEEALSKTAVPKVINTPKVREVLLGVRSKRPEEDAAWRQTVIDEVRKNDPSAADLADSLREKYIALDSRWEGIDGANVMPLMLRGDYMKGFTPGEFQEGFWNLNMGQAKRAGKDGVKFENVIDTPTGYGDPATSVAVFNPANIRSRFAAFDPAKKDSADLLAGVIGLPGGSFLTGLNQERSKRGISKIAK